VVISRTPLRISLAGGGTDLPDFYRENEWGAVTSTAIHSYVTICVAPKFDGGVRAAYSIQDSVDTVLEIKHSIIRECLRWCGIKSGIEVMVYSEIPGNSGLGGSSSFTVGLLNALYAYQGKQISRWKLAEDAHGIERFFCGVPVGKQDHYIAAFGGTRHFMFSEERDMWEEEKKGKVKTLRGIGLKGRLDKHLLLFHIGKFRSAEVILKDLRDRIDEHDKILQAMREHAVRMYKALKFYGTQDDPGKIIQEGWKYKRLLSPYISNEYIDSLVYRVLDAGATGAKIGGAGGGGFLVVWADPSTHENIRAKLGLREWPVKTEAPGSKIIYAD